MATGFKERVRDVCLMAGITVGDAFADHRPTDCQCCADLAQRCGYPVQTVEHWIDTDGESMTGAELIALCDATHVAGEFLLKGTGPVTRSAPSPQAATAALLLDELTANEIHLWLRYGTRMLERHK